MKKLIYIISLFFLQLFTCQFKNTFYDDQQLSLSLRAGLDFPAYSNQTSYINYKQDLNLGLSLDYYFNQWLGIGIDGDYLKNKSQNTYPTDQIYIGSSPLQNPKIEENKIDRLFLGLGPNFRWVLNDNLAIAFKLKGGISNIKGGLTSLVFDNNTTTNYHIGYDSKNVLSGKGQLEFSWFFSDYVGVNIGAYYLQHFNVKDLENTNSSYTYIPYTSNNNQHNLNIASSEIRKDPLSHEVHSVGFNIGLDFRIPTKSVDKNTLTVTAKDKVTGEILPDVIVELYKDKKKHYTTRTNAQGVAFFKNLKAANYEIKGNLYNIDLQNNSVNKSEFVKNQIVKKEIVTDADNFIVKGLVKVCNSSNSLGGTIVVLKNQNDNTSKEFTTDALGRFYFKASKNTTYTIYGKKGNYFSKTELLTSKNIDRNNILFLNLNVCMEEAICGKKINLQNIHYDLDKFNLKNEAKIELNKLVQFMKDNPKITVELSSHTDSRATENYNVTLSQNRANAAVDYIAEQGINKNRLKAIGYGETQLLNHCKDGIECTEEQHQINRRTELKIVCVK